jgi:hypothetical protein
MRPIHIAYKQYNILLIFIYLPNKRPFAGIEIRLSKFKKYFIFALFKSFSVKQLTLSSV